MTSPPDRRDKHKYNPAPPAQIQTTSKQSDDVVPGRQGHQDPAGDSDSEDSEPSSNHPRKPRQESLQNPGQANEPPAQPEHFVYASSRQTQSLLSQSLRGFLAIPLGNYKACERYCRDNSEVWSENVDELRRLSVRYLTDGRDEDARRCAERWLMVTSARHRKLNNAEAIAYLKGLLKDDSNFQIQLDQILIKFGQEIESTDPMPPTLTKQEPETTGKTGGSAPAKTGHSVRSAASLTQGSRGTAIRGPARRTSDAAEQQRRMASIPHERLDTLHSPSHILTNTRQEVESSAPTPPAPSRREPQAPGYTRVPASTKAGLPVRSAAATAQGAHVNPVQKPIRRPSDAAEQPRRLASMPGERSDTQHSPTQHKDWFPMAGSKRGETDRRTTASEALKGAFQEAVSDADAAETVDDNITLDNRTASITGEKEEAGPNLDLFDDGYENKDVLNKSFKLRTGPQAKSFFVKGRVFAMVWHENAGTPLRPKMTEISESLDKPFHRTTRNKDGILIFSHIRHFVIVKAKSEGNYCYVLPINTYGGYGLLRKKMQREELQAHAIIHASDKNPIRLKGEPPLTKEPLAVEMVKGEVLRTASRLHFGKMQSVDWNIRAKNIGMVTKKHVQRLTLYFNQEFHRGEETEVEAGPSHRRPASQDK